MKEMFTITNYEYGIVMGVCSSYDKAIKNLCKFIDNDGDEVEEIEHHSYAENVWEVHTMQNTYTIERFIVDQMN